MRSLMLPSLLLAGSLFAACTSENESPSTVETTANGPRGEAPTFANSPEPVIAANLANYNENLPRRGDMLPAIAGQTLDGTPISNATLTGKTTLINLWFYH